LSDGCFGEQIVTGTRPKKRDEEHKKFLMKKTDPTTGGGRGKGGEEGMMTGGGGSRVLGFTVHYPSEFISESKVQPFTKEQHVEPRG